ncbi:MAG: hypothetical protein AB1513_08750 [Pseudomonadota bacterium]
MLTHRLFALFGALLPAFAIAAPANIDYRQGGSVTLPAPSAPATAQFALIPGGPYLKSEITLKNPALALESDGHYIYAAAGDSGLLILDITTRRLLAQVKGHGKLTHLALRDGHAYLVDEVGGSSALLIVDVHDPLQPRTVASIPLSHAVNALGIEQKRVYLVSGQRLAIYDVRRTQSPKPLGQFTLPDEAVALQVSGSHAYFALPEAGLVVVDVSNPARPRETGRFRAQAWDVAVAQDRVYLANGTTGLTVVDVSDPQVPRWLGSVNHIGMALGVSHDHGRIALRNERNEVVLINVDNPRLPSVVAVQPLQQPAGVVLLQGQGAFAAIGNSVVQIDFSVPAPDVVNLGANYGGSRRAALQGNLFYVADWFSGLHVYDISMPDAPRHVAAYHTQGSPKGVLVRDHYAFIADDDHGVQILDIADPRSPRKISSVATPGLAYTMKLVGDTLYLADHRGGFHIIDITNIAHPAIAGSAPTPGKVWAVDVLDRTAYLAADKAGLLVFDVSNPQRPRQIAEFDIDGAAEDVVIRDNLAYVASFDRGLFIFDITHPALPRQLGHLATPGNARGIALQGRLAYVADWVSGIQVVDISNPGQPVLIGSLDTAGWSWGVKIKDNHAYVLDWWGGLNVLDVSNPEAPKQVGTYHARGNTEDVAVRSDYAYVADGDNGLQIFDIKNPLNPIWIAGVDLKGEAKSVCLIDSVAYVATEAELAAVDVSNPFEPRLLRTYLSQADVVRAWGRIIYAAQRQRGIALIDHTAAQQAAWYEAPLLDAWAMPERLLLATVDGVEIISVADPYRPRLFKRLPLRAQLVRAQDELLVLYDRDTGFTLLDLITQQPLGRFNPGEQIHDFRLDGKRLYASGEQSGLLVLDIADPRHPVLKAAYPAATRVTRFDVYAGTAFMAGNDMLTSVRLLPDITLASPRSGMLNASVPANLPPGGYHLLALDPASGQRTVHPDALRATHVPSGKPRFTREDFERAMRERGLAPAEP